MNSTNNIMEEENIEVCPFCANDRNNRSTCCGEYFGEYGWIKLSELEEKF